MVWRSELKNFFFKILLILIVFISTQSYALDVQLFRPNFDQQGGIAVQNSKTIPRLKFAPGVFINWVRNPIEFGLPNDTRTDTLVGWFATIDLLLATGITDDLTVGFDMPFNLSSNIEPIGTIVQEASSTIGDLNLYAKYRLRKQNEDQKIIPGIAIVPFMTIPTGDDAVFFGNDQMTGGFKLAMDWIFSDRQNLSFNVGPRFREKDTVLNLTVGNELMAGLGYNRLIWEKQKLNLSVELVGSTTFSKFMSEEISSPAELLIGIQKPWMNDQLHSTFGIGRGGTNGYGSPDIRIFLGAVYFFERKPRIDTDGDSIPDDRDQCPNEPEDKDGFQDEEGCPDPDNDHDGILDVNDKCPNEPETINGINDEDGCPDQGESKVSIQGDKIVILEKVYFATNKSIILEKSNSILNQVAAVLKANPQITKVRVEGHTDDRGDDNYNMGLSQRRANSVRQFLINNGIAEERLESVGYGETKPIDTNNTSSGRDSNRRVEFTILPQTINSEAPTKLEVKPSEPAKVDEKSKEEAKPVVSKPVEKKVKKKTAVKNKPVEVINKEPPPPEPEKKQSGWKWPW